VRHIRPHEAVPAIGGEDADGIEAEADVCVAWCDSLRLHQVGEHEGAVFAHRTKLKFDGDAPVEMDALEGVFQDGLRLRKAVAVVGHRALEDETKGVRAVVQIVEDLAVGRLAVGDVDALHDRPRRRRRAAGYDVRILRWTIERLDDDTVIALRLERSEGRALQRLFHQRLPGRLVGAGKVAGQGKGKFSHVH
jgi:hypothetical protein